MYTSENNIIMMVYTYEWTKFIKQCTLAPNIRQVGYIIRSSRSQILYVSAGFFFQFNN